MRTNNFSNNRSHGHTRHLDAYGFNRPSRKPKGFRAISAAIIVIGVLVLGTMGIVAGNFFFGSPTVDRCMVTGKSAIVSGGDSTPMVDTTCGSFASWNHRTVSKLQVGSTYDIEYSAGFFTIPDIMKSAILVP